MNKCYIIGAVLLLCMNISPVCAQNTKESQYVFVKHDLVDKIVNDLLAKQGNIDAVQKGWAETLLRTAFQNYFSNKASKAAVYDQTAWNELNDLLSALNDTIKKRDGIIKSLQKQVSKQNFGMLMEEAKKSWEQERAQLENKHSTLIASKDMDIIALKSHVEALVQDSIKRKQEIDVLVKNVAIAKNVTEQYNQKVLALDDLYKEYKNSQTLEYVKADLTLQTISEYSEYLKIVGVSMPIEQKTQIEYLQSVSKVAELYQSATNILDARHDDQAVQKWIQSYKSINTYLPKLNNGQQTIMAQIEKAMSSLGAANNHFKKSILVYLQEQGQIPDGETAQEVKDMVQLKVRNYSDGKHEDITKYNPYHANLNKVLESVFVNIKVMNDAAYQSFISNIENAL